jgi:hypothetical protein
MSDLTIASAPEQLTADWLTAALTGGGHLDGVRVVDVAAKPLGTGQMCDSVRLTLTYDGETAAPASLVAKLPAADDVSRGTAIAMRSYEKEVRFYELLAPQLPMATPPVFHVALDPEDLGRFVLLMADMAPAEQGDQLTGCSPEVAAAAVHELVGLHAPRWGDDSLHELEWLDAGDAQSNAEMATMMLPMLWTGFQERYAERLGSHVIEAGTALFADIGAHLARNGSPETVVHGDYRLDNLLISPEGGVAGVVDWQTCTIGRALSDVSYFIGAGLLEDDRRAHEEALVRGYLADLEAAGVSGYSWDRCWEDYLRGTFAGLLMAVAASMMVERTDRGDEMFLTMASRHSHHILDHDAIALLRG